MCAKKTFLYAVPEDRRIRIIYNCNEVRKPKNIYVFCKKETIEKNLYNISEVSRGGGCGRIPLQHTTLTPCQAFAMPVAVVNQALWPNSPAGKLPAVLC